MLTTTALKDVHPSFNLRGEFQDKRTEYYTLPGADKRLLRHDNDIDILIRRFEYNGFAKPGELEYLRNFRNDFNNTVNVISELGEIPCPV